jgi:NADPH-dependent 2,4-dienoyl-CoA reductase/sulfur reductase-like enzyme
MTVPCRHRDIVVIGGGPAGLAAAIAARKAGVENLLLIERDAELGGILPQCIHTGFGLKRFGKEMTGPEYIDRFIREAESLKIPVALNTMVTELTPQRRLIAIGEPLGLVEIKSKAVILAMGCRERSRGAIGIPGARPAGVLTAGTAQRLLNRQGLMPGRRIVVVGSGDIGLIMARRFTLEGAKVLAVVEMMPYPGGLTRNIVQCLDDFGIPLHLRSAVTKIHGRKRVEGVTVAQLDEKGAPIPDSERAISCDTVLLSAGLVPENELSVGAGVKLDAHTLGPVIDQDMETVVPGVFACGDVAYVHNLVDWVTADGEKAGVAAARQVLGQQTRSVLPRPISVLPGEGVHCVVPQRITRLGPDPLTLSCRPKMIARDVTVHIRDEKSKAVHSALRKIVRPAEIFDIKVRSDKIRGCRELIVEIAGK